MGEGVMNAVTPSPQEKQLSTNLQLACSPRTANQSQDGERA